MRNMTELSGMHNYLMLTSNGAFLGSAVRAVRDHFGPHSGPHDKPRLSKSFH